MIHPRHFVLSPIDDRSGSSKLARRIGPGALADGAARGLGSICLKIRSKTWSPCLSLVVGVQLVEMNENEGEGGRTMGSFHDAMKQLVAMVTNGQGVDMRLRLTAMVEDASMPDL
jgi:hypothetical protein